ncbi:hypothetical protein V8F20_011292 [Naviculisporaceae sp. PSN 640]
MPNPPLRSPLTISPNAPHSVIIQQVHEWLSANNISTTTGIVTINSTDRHSLSKRAEDLPEGCNFAREGVTGWAYRSFTDKHGPACFGQDLYTQCGNGQLQDPDKTDVQTAMRKHVAKDGFFKVTHEGDWFAGWMYSTTAFAHRDTDLFVAGLMLAGRKSVEYYWSHTGDYASFITPKGCP